MEARVELMLQIRHAGAPGRINNDASHRADVRRQLPRPDRILGDEPEEVRTSKNPSSASDLDSEPTPQAR